MTRGARVGEAKPDAAAPGPPPGPDRHAAPDPPTDRDSPAAPHDGPGGPREAADDEDQRDLELVEAIRAGDNDAWATLLGRYQDRLYGICLRMVRDRDRAADCTQDAMVRIIQGIDSYDGRARLSTWMIRVTMNVVLSRLRRERIRNHPSIEALGEASGRSRDGVSSRGRAEGGEPAPELGVSSREGQSRIFDALQRLNPEQRAILILRDARGLEYEQIAEVLDVALGTVKSRLFRARAALREVLEGGAGPEPSSGMAGDPWEL